MIEIENCYSKGDLAQALRQAADFVEKIGKENVLHVIAREDTDLPGAWAVDVVYYVPNREGIA